MELNPDKPNDPDLQGSLFDIGGLETEESSWQREIMSSLEIPPGPAWPDRFGRSVRGWLDNAGHEPIKTLSLFSGGGGLDVGFHDSGFGIVQMVELERKYADTLAANSRPGRLLEGSEPLCMDIREYGPDDGMEVDFVIGGPPCQTFSAAGRRAAGVSGTTDSRGTLFEEYVRILEKLRPKGFLFENVYGITGAQSGEAWRQIQAAFKSAGYTTRYRILDAADYGVPQHRERLFIVGVREGDFHFPRPTHGPDSMGDHPFYIAGEAVSGASAEEVEIGLGGRYGHLLGEIPPGLNYSFYTKEMGHPSPVFSWRSKFSDFLYKADPDSPSRTLKAQGGQYTGPFSWENRKFSVAELKRLQTIPDDYEITGGQQASIEQIGNSVPPQMGRMLALAILHQVMGVELPFPMRYMTHDKKLGFRKRKRLLTKRYREKAEAAIARLHGTNTPTPRSSNGEEEYTKFLSKNFRWEEVETPGSTKVKLRFRMDESSMILSAGVAESRVGHTAYEVTVEPSSDGDWCFGERKVRLVAEDGDLRTFTSLWKAFEEKTHELCRIADLVQLSGYYQYRPKMKARMDSPGTGGFDGLWHVVGCVVSGIGVAKQLPARHFAVLWEIEGEDVLSNLALLRGMGYEVRSHNTNSQIAEGEYLIPYSFPTLTPKSVQLRKKLEAHG
ncbi:MAG: DNA cytosine methyltransferase [Rubrobacteraceae bacterium]|jgi:DNA (cytosine-5)-methyltransferase 1